MSSKVQICNRALSYLGADQITSITEDTQAAKRCNLLFDDIAREVIGEGQWTTCTFRATLNRLVETPVYGYSYYYQLPTNPKLIRLIEINEEYPGQYDFRVEGDKLLINEENVSIRYIGNVTDTEAYGPYLTRCIALRLAAELGYTITAKQGYKGNLLAQYYQELDNALMLDGSQGSSRDIATRDLLEVR